MKSIDITLDNYTGPLDLLLDLIRKNEINIYDIPINFITSEYIKAIQSSIYKGIEIQVEFLYLASILISLKTRMLLPKSQDEDDDPRVNLVEQIILYSQFKELSNELSLLNEKNMLSYDRLRNPYINIDSSKIVIEEDVNKLSSVFNDLIKNMKLREDSEPEGLSIQKDPYTVEKLIPKILNELNLIGKSSLRHLVSKADKKYIITSFLAILELLNTGMINFKQDNTFGEITLEKIDGK